MRALIIAILLLVGLGAGGYFYVHTHPETLTASAPPAPPPRAARPEDCPTLRARYQFAGESRFTLTFERIPSHDPGGIEMAEEFGHRVGNLKFIVHFSTSGLDYPLTPDNSRSNSGGHAFEAYAMYLRSPEGARIQIHQFNSEMHYLANLPRDDTPAPAGIYMPDLMPALLRHHIDFPADMFRFVSCDPAPAAATTTGTATTTSP